MIYVYKLLPLLVSPICIIIAIIVYAALKRSRPLGILAAIFFYAASMPLIGDRLSIWLDNGAVRLNPDAVPSADAIIVLSGMIGTVPGINGPVTEWGAPNRFFGGLELIAANKAPVIVFSGGRMPWERQSRLEGEVLKEFAIKEGIDAQKILVTDEVSNTEEEAYAARKLLPDTHGRILLVTSAFHMPRASALFTARGFYVVPYPVDISGGILIMTAMDLLPSAGALMATDRFFREQLGRLFYSTKYYLKSVLAEDRAI